MIDRVIIAGLDCDPRTVEATAFVIMHGRAAVGDGPTASTATIVMRTMDMPAWTPGDSLELTGPTGHTFSGIITDILLEHETDPTLGTVGRFTLTATGPLATLATCKIGAAPWPAESGLVRAGRILAGAGLPYRLEGDTDYLVTALDVDDRAALELITDLASTTGAAVFDTPDGMIVYQAQSGRNRPVEHFRWQDWDALLPWSGIDPALTWAGMEGWHSTDSVYPLSLPPGAVEYEPQWITSSAGIVNHARIGYGSASPQAWAEATDATSITRYGPRYAYTGTMLADVAQATDRARHLVSTHAWPSWAMGDVTVWPEKLDTDTALELEAALCGRHVTVSGLPAPGPSQHWTGILEGWTYRQETRSDGIHSTRTLALSDVAASLALMRWADYPADYTWADHSSLIQWNDLLALSILEASA